MKNSMLPRFGTFFIVVGFGFLILFVASVLAGEISLPFLLFSIAALFIGSLFHRAAPRAEPTRFSGIRKVGQRSREHSEEKLATKDQEK